MFLKNTTNKTRAFYYKWFSCSHINNDRSLQSTMYLYYTNMANKTYVAIFVPHKVRDAIKKQAKKEDRTIIGHLKNSYKVK